MIKNKNIGIEIGKQYTLDLGGIGPSFVTVEKIDKNVIYYRTYTNRLDSLNINDFKYLCSIK